MEIFSEVLAWGSDSLICWLFFSPEEVNMMRLLRAIRSSIEGFIAGLFISFFPVFLLMWLIYETNKKEKERKRREKLEKKNLSRHSLPR